MSAFLLHLKQLISWSAVVATGQGYLMRSCCIPEYFAAYFDAVGCLAICPDQRRQLHFSGFKPGLWLGEAT
jgi:hypothetical protein